MSFIQQIQVCETSAKHMGA